MLLVGHESPKFDFTYIQMLAVDAFEERHDGILVEQQPQAEPKHERSENLNENRIKFRFCASTAQLTKKMKLKRQRMYLAQHDPTS